MLARKSVCPWGFVALAVASLTLPGLVDAEPIWPKSYADGASRKFGRGVANVLTAPLEMVRTPSLLSKSEGGFAGLTVGVVQGARAMVLRELAGLFEVTTFFLPVPKEFQPLVLPEFVYAHGDWVP